MRSLHAPIDMIFDPVKHHKIKIYCFFSTEKHLACRSTYKKTKNKIRHGRAFQCYYCSNYYIRKNRYDRLTKNCTAIPGILYNFDTQNLVTFQDNLKYKGHLLFVAYYNFETAAPRNCSRDPEITKMFAMLYIIIFAFHPDLNKHQ